jgi:hypothetical protein
MQMASQTGKEICTSVSWGKPFGGFHSAQFISQAVQEIGGMETDGCPIIDQSWMPRPAHWIEMLDPVSAVFTYVEGSDAFAAK